MAFFDRTPDSLFGDDVKTRNAILLLEKRASEESRLATTSFIRWNSRNRPQLFNALEFVPSDWNLSKKIIPKLGTPAERRAYAALRSSRRPVLGSEVSSVSVTDDDRTSGELLHYSSTAYNWIPVYRGLPKSGAFRSGYWSVECRSSADADVLFAVSASRLVYWLWRVEGDGFRYPLGTSSRGYRSHLLIFPQTNMRPFARWPSACGRKCYSGHFTLKTPAKFQ